MYLHRYIQLHWFTQGKLKDYTMPSLKASSQIVLKAANIMQVCNENEPTNEKNFRTLCVLRLFSKLSERLMHVQLSEYIKQHLNS